MIVTPGSQAPSVNIGGTVVHKSETKQLICDIDLYVYFQIHQYNYSANKQWPCTA